MKSGSSNMIATIEAESIVELWHRRLGHMSQKGMKVLLSKGKLLELKLVSLDMCESYILWKHKSVSFLRDGRGLRLTKLELVHVDLWEPSSVSSLGGSRYYLTFIDDYSRKVWVYLP